MYLTPNVVYSKKQMNLKSLMAEIKLTASYKWGNDHLGDMFLL